MSFLKSYWEFPVLRTLGVSVTFRHIYLHTAPAFDVPAVVEGALLQRQEALDAVIEIVALIRMRKELCHVGQAFMVSRIVHLKK